VDIVVVVVVAIFAFVGSNVLSKAFVEALLEVRGFIIELALVTSPELSFRLLLLLLRMLLRSTVASLADVALSLAGCTVCCTVVVLVPPIVASVRKEDLSSSSSLLLLVYCD
jgi:hypothetical protein